MPLLKTVSSLFRNQDSADSSMSVPRRSAPYRGGLFKIDFQNFNNKKVYYSLNFFRGLLLYM